MCNDVIVSDQHQSEMIPQISPMLSENSVIPHQPWWIETSKDGVVGTTLEISNKSLCVIGRSSNCDVVLDHPSISRQHAVLMHLSTGYVVMDLGSVHGTSLALTIPTPENEQGTPKKVRVIRRRIAKHEQVPLKAGQQIALGASKRVLTLRGTSQSREPPIQCEKKRTSLVTPLDLTPRTMSVSSASALHECSIPNRSAVQTMPNPTSTNGIETCRGADKQGMKVNAKRKRCVTVC